MTFAYFSDLMEVIGANWPFPDWRITINDENEWWLEIKHVDYHRVIREENYTLIKMEHNDGSVMWLSMENSDFSCSYNHTFDKMICLIIKKDCEGAK